jgi:enoyl-CoA hydratase
VSNYDDYKTLLVNLDAPVLEVVLNLPDSRNAITYPMEAEIWRVGKEASDDDRVKVITLTGAGDLFCAGHDLKEVASGYATVGRPAGKPYRIPGLFPLWYCTKPIVAGVHKYVGPMGADLLAHCDFVIAAENTRFSWEQARMGGGVMAYSPLVFQLPMRVWKKMCMAGGWFSGEDALKWDFVQRVVPREELETTVRHWADQLAMVPIRQLVAAKQGIHRQYEIMGLVNMACIQNAETGHGDPEDKLFFQMVMDVGLKKALEFRNDGVDTDFTRI